MIFFVLLLLTAISGIFAGEDVINTALLIGAGDAGRNVWGAVEFWPQIDGSSCPPVENLPFSLFGHSAAVLGSCVHTCGGTNLPDYLNDCYFIDMTVGGDWLPAPSMRQKRSEFSLVSMGDYLLAIGGIKGQGQRLDSIEICYGDSWRVEELTLTTPRFAHCSVKINEEEVLVLGGGGNDASAINGRLSSVEIVNILDGTSSIFVYMTMPRMYFGCSFSEEENRVYVSGGSGTTTLVEYLDLATREWTRIANMNDGRDSHQMGIIGGKLTVFGGVGHDYIYKDSVEQYNASEDIWEDVEPLQAARSSMGMVELSC
jgi:hypothetical protein